MIVVGTVYYHPIAIFHYFYGTLLILTGDAVLSYIFIIFNARCEGMGIAMEMKMRLRVEWKRPLSSEKVARQLLLLRT